MAGKIAQQYNKPTAIFQKGETESKGSFRSIPQINIIETIGQCSEFLIRFGGHSQAAGVSIENSKMEAFFEKMDSLIEKQLKGIELCEQIIIDSKLSASDLDFSLTDSLEKMQPFGEGNREPIFLLENMRIMEKRLVGSTSKHMKFTLAPEGGSPKLFDSISFNGAEKFSIFQVGDTIEAVCMASSDEWNGHKKIQLILLDAKKQEN